MSTKQSGSMRGAKDVRLANRAKGIRAQLRRRLSELDSIGDTSRVNLIRQIIATAARHRLRMARWRDLDQTERDAVSGAMAAASLVALDCGMTRGEFVEWLRSAADDFERTAQPRPAPVAVHLPSNLPPRANGAKR